MAVEAPCTANAVLATAISQLGVHEDPPKSSKQPYGAWYGMNGAAWCAMFVSWVLHHSGFPLKVSSAKGYAYCPDGVAWFKKQGAWAGPEVTPKRGWVIFFDFPNDDVHRVSHTGLVEGVLADGRVATVEGNTNPKGGRTGGEVMRHNRSVAGGIVGYGIITYKTPVPTHEEDDDMRLLNISDGADGGKVFLLWPDKTSKYVSTPQMLTDLEKVYGKTVTISGDTWALLHA